MPPGKARSRPLLRRNVVAIAYGVRTHLSFCLVDAQSGPKSEATNSRPRLCRILTDLQSFFTERFLGKFAVNWLLKIPPFLAYVATLPCENIRPNVRKEAINDKLQGV